MDYSLAVLENGEQVPMTAPPNITPGIVGSVEVHKLEITADQFEQVRAQAMTNDVDLATLKTNTTMKTESNPE